MRVLFISHHPPVRELGAPKVLIELADAVRALGHHAEVVGPMPRAEDVREYLTAHASEHDVVDFDHEDLPFDRSQFPRQTLLVARSVLLVQHLERIELPQPSGARAALSKLVNRSVQRRRIERADETIRHADLVNVSNDRDRDELIRRGFRADKIVVLPFGIDSARRKLFDAIPLDRPRDLSIAFVGTFDYRKGANDLVKIFSRVAADFPQARLHLLGTAGLIPDAQSALNFFPAELRARVHVVPRFKTDELPALLAGCSVGVFPSYYEGFGFGVLEMLAAGIPVVAYDAPGPPMMLPCERLVSPGDIDAMAGKLRALLSLDVQSMQRERIAARASSQRFDWFEIARETIKHYSDRLPMK